MSIVLPKKNADFLAPSKALQDARAKLGPIYFDAKLIECPQNAVELTKLLQKWDSIDKKKFRAIEETKRSQRILLHTLTSRYTFSKSIASLEAIPDLRDIKLPPPGFRYHSNGEPKLSLQVSDPKLKVDEFLKSLDDWQYHADEQNVSPAGPCEDASPAFHYPDYSLHQNNADETIEDQDEKNSEHSGGNYNFISIPKSTDKYVSGESSITLVRPPTPENVLKIDYEKEIRDLEKIIKEINEDLEHNKIDLYENSGSMKGKVCSFLRAHARGDKISLKKLIGPSKDSRPNDRFAFQPGASTFQNCEGILHKRRFKPPNHGCCIACSMKLKHDKQEFKQMKQDLTKTVYRRWNVAPQGKFVEKPLYSSTSSSMSFHHGKSTTSLHKSRAKSCLTFKTSTTTPGFSLEKNAASHANFHKDPVNQDHMNSLNQRHKGKSSHNIGHGIEHNNDNKTSANRLSVNNRKQSFSSFSSKRDIPKTGTGIHVVVDRTEAVEATTSRRSSANKTISTVSFSKENNSIKSNTDIPLGSKAKPCVAFRGNLKKSGIELKRAASARTPVTLKHSSTLSRYTRPESQMLINHIRSTKSAMSRKQVEHSAMDFMKSIAKEEGAVCEKKVKDFLTRLSKFNETPKPKFAFT